MKKQEKKTVDKKDCMTLNKYLAYAGICSRRQAVDYIKKGLVKVNSKVVIEPGYRVEKEDKVTLKNKPLQTENKIYILLNKPKDYITTVSDERGRRTVLDIVKGVVKERVYPVGRLDRTTTGLLLLTNDGQLAQKLSHPSNEVKKVYSVVLDKPLEYEDIKKIREGVRLIDGVLPVDKIFYVEGKSKSHVRIQIHSGKNRVVRRLFRELEYKVVKLDRIDYAGLTKRGLYLGRCRDLTSHEIFCLKKFGEIKGKNYKVGEGCGERDHFRKSGSR